MAGDTRNSHDHTDVDERPGSTDSTTILPPPRGEKITKKTRRRWRRWWTEDLSTNYADIPFILCSLVTGLSDGVSYATFGCFISMQTGNTVIMGLGASHMPPDKPLGWLRSLTSIASFLVGSFVFSRITRALGPTRRLTMSLSFLIQYVSIIIGASVIQAGVVSHNVNSISVSASSSISASAISAGNNSMNHYELIPLAVLAFGFGGQLSAARSMGFNEIPTVVLTSVYFDIMSDPHLLSPSLSHNVKRNRRIASALAVLIGAISAGWLARSDAGMQTALWIGAFIKLVIVGAWVLWPAKEEDGN